MKSFVLLAGFLVVVPLASGQTPEQRKQTITYLQRLQTKEGGFLLAGRAPAPSLRATSAALRALKYFGGTVPDVEGCKKFVLSCRDAASGGFADTPGGKPGVILTAVGLMALVELKIPVAPYEKAAIEFMARNARDFEEVRMAAAGLETIGRRSTKNPDWLANLARMQNADGTFGKGAARTRDTGGAVAAVLRLGGAVKEPKAIVATLDAGQRKDGGFGKADASTSDLETSYRVLRTYVMLGARPARADALRAFVASCRAVEGGYGVEPGAPPSAGGTYFASIILHWLDTK